MIRSNKIPKGLTLPGDLFRRSIKFGVPEVKGVYVVFFKHFPALAHDNFPMCGMKVAHWSEGAWGCGEMVLAFLGPLPILSLDEMLTEQECVGKQYAIGTLKQAAKGQFVSNNHPQYILATLCPEHSKKGNFIWELSSHKMLPTPVAKYDEEGFHWEKIENPTTYLKTIKLLQKGK